MSDPVPDTAACPCGHDWTEHGVNGCDFPRCGCSRPMTSAARCPHGELIGWHCAGCLWGCGEDDHEHATECTCTNWCGESSEAGCCYCVARDIYEPCPAVGFGCGMGAKPGSPACDCCSVDQWQAARSA